MANLHVFLVSAIFVVIVSLLPSLLVPVEAKFSLAGLSTDVFSSQGLHTFRLLAERTPFGPLSHSIGHHPPNVGHHKGGNDPCKPALAAGLHPIGTGHHMQADGNPCVTKKRAVPKGTVPPYGHHPTGGHHPKGVGHRGGKGHHPPGVGKHPPGVGGHGLGKGHHPLKGHHCDHNATECLHPPTPVGSTTCCGRTCTNLSTNPSHCGSCGKICPSGSGCCGGVCTDFRSNPAHCGNCATVCAPGVTCSFGLCGYV